MVEKEQKTWRKANLTPEFAKILKRIALDNDTYMYLIIENAVKKQFPQYFKK
jgi:hypothetical protein